MDDLSIKLTASVPDSPGYLIAGFPNAKVVVSRKRRGYDADLLPYFCDRAPADLYDALGFKPSQHLLLNYDIKHSAVIGSGQPSRTVHPVGMSGGGVWYIQPPLIGDLRQDKFYLVGLLIEYHADHKVVVATRMDLVDEILQGLGDF